MVFLYGDCEIGMSDHSKALASVAKQEIQTDMPMPTKDRFYIMVDQGRGVQTWFYSRMNDKSSTELAKFSQKNACSVLRTPTGKFSVFWELCSNAAKLDAWLAPQRQRSWDRYGLLIMTMFCLLMSTVNLKQQSYSFLIPVINSSRSVRSLLARKLVMVMVVVAVVVVVVVAGVVGVVVGGAVAIIVVVVVVVQMCSRAFVHLLRFWGRVMEGGFGSQPNFTSQSKQCTEGTMVSEEPPKPPPAQSTKATTQTTQTHPTTQHEEQTYHPKPIKTPKTPPNTPPEPQPNGPFSH